MQSVVQAAAPENQHCRQRADAAWRQTEPGCGWFDTVLFQAGPSTRYCLTKSIHESSSQLTGFKYLKQPLSAVLHHEDESILQ